MYSAMPYVMAPTNSKSGNQHLCFSSPFFLDLQRIIFSFTAHSSSGMGQMAYLQVSASLSLGLVGGSSSASFLISSVVFIPRSLDPLPLSRKQ